MNVPHITEVNKDTFWTLIDQAKEHSGGPSEWLMEQLVSMGPEQAKKYDTIARVYMDAAYQYGLWTAASVMERNGCSDDGFIDFRAWLVGQGREVYLSALKAPDSIANAPSYQDSRFDALPYMGNHAYEELTGRDTFQDFDPAEYRMLAAEIKKYPVWERDWISLYLERSRCLPPQAVRQIFDAGRTGTPYPAA